MSVSGLIPVYNVLVINLGDTDGQTAFGRLISQQTGFIKVAFRDINGSPVNNVRIQVAFGMSNEDKLTLDYNGKVRCLVPVFEAGKLVGQQTVDQFRLFWNNTPGVYAYVTISQNSTLFEDDTPNPIQSFTQSVAQTLGNGSVNVGTTATLILASASNRQSAIIVNNGANIIYIGGATVTTATGFPLQVGQAITLDKGYEAIYGVVAAATENVRYLTEST